MEHVTFDLDNIIRKIKELLQRNNLNLNVLLYVRTMYTIYYINTVFAVLDLYPLDVQ